MSRLPVYWLSCVLMLLAVSAGATTIVMPTDEQLVSKSPVIVVGSVVSSAVVERDGAIWTETSLLVEETLKGSPEQALTIREIGGTLGDRITHIFGSPEYVPGQRVMAFLTATPRGDYQTVDLFVGKFSEGRTLDGTRLWLRNDHDTEAVLLDSTFSELPRRNVQRVAEGFERFIAAQAAGRKSASSAYLISNPILARPEEAAGPRLRSQFTLISEPTVYRWFTFDSGGSAAWQSQGTQTGYSDGGISEIRTAMAAWTSYSAARILYTYNGVFAGSAAGLQRPNGINEVLLNDPLAEIAGSWNRSTGGVVGQGGFNGVASARSWVAPFAADATHTQTTYRAYSIVEGNLTIQDGVSPANGINSNRLAEIIAHEFGHTLGFGHSAESNALMYATVTGLGPSLRSDDQTAARWLYPSGSAAPPPTPTPTPSAPAAPSNLSATVRGNTVDLSWTDNAGNESGFSVYYASGSGSFSKIGDVAANERGASVSGFANGSYRLYVTAFNSTGESTASNTVSVTIGGSAPAPPAATIPPAPTGLNASMSGSSVILQWTDQASNETGQSVYYAAGSSGFTRLGNVAADQSSAVLTGFTTGSYRFYVTAFNSAGESAASNIATLNIGSPLTASFRLSPGASGVAGSTSFSFTDESSGATSRVWSFGDGASSTAAIATHVYAAAGQYTVVLTVSNGSAQAQASTTITVSAPAPPVQPLVAQFSFSPSQPAAEDQVTFADQSTGGVTARSWSFGDGTSSTAANPVKRYMAAGTYAVTLTVYRGSESAVVTRNVQVASRAPVAPPVETFSSMISVSAQTNGAGGSVWRTELTLFNGGQEGADVQLLFVGGPGSSLQSRSLFLGPRQSRTYANALQDLFGISSGAGAILVQANGATATPVIRLTSRTFNDTVAGTYGQAVPDVSSNDLQRTLHVTGMVATGEYRTNVGLVNRSASPIAATLTLLDDDGSTLSVANVTLAPNSFQQSSLSALFPAMNGRSEAALSMSVSTSAQDALSVYASVVDNRTQDPIYLQALPPSAERSATIPVVGRSAGANGTFWRSDLTLFNPAASSLTVGLRYFGAGGGARAITLRGRETVVLRDVVQQMGAPDGGGALLLEWNGSAAPVAASRTYTTVSGGGTYGQSVDAVASFGLQQYVTGLRSDHQFRSNIGFVNGSDQPLTVEVTLLSQDGQAVASRVIGLGGRGQIQYSLVSLFPGVNAALGSFTLQARADRPALFAYGSMVDNLSADPVFFSGR